MTDVQELDRLAHDYYLRDPAGDIDIEELAQRRSFPALRRAIGEHRRVLEMGFGTGCITAQLLDAGIAVEVVEGSAVLAAEARRRHPGLVVHEAMFEAFAPPAPYDAVLALHVLEHVADPVALARHLASWVRPGGSLIAVCPNRESLHRRLAVRMGVQPALDTLSDRDRMVGHLRVYSLDDLAADLEAAGLRVEHRFGYLLKTLPNAMQLDHPPALLAAMSDVGEELAPELLANIGVAAVRP
jgi:2-polyprenyl-3-methyl-5-hydroxy-6-metoxy-1,4-benzoquinol methylase